MHSSRMRTACSSSCPGGYLLPERGASLPGGCLLPGVGSPWEGASLLGGGMCLLPRGSPCQGGISFPGGSPCRGASFPGGSPCQGDASLLGGCLPAGGSPCQGVPPSFVGGWVPPSGGSPSWETPLWTEWQTGVKILPCPKLRLRAVIRLQQKQIQVETNKSNESKEGHSK